MQNHEIHETHEKLFAGIFPTFVYFVYFVVNKEMEAWGPLNSFFEFKQADLFTANAAHIFRIASTVRCEQIRLFTLKNN